MEDCTESHQTWNEILGEQSRSQVGQHCRPPWAPVRPASRCRILLVSLLQVSTPLSLVGLLAHFPLCKAYRALFVFGRVEWVTRATYISTPSKPIFFSSGPAVTNEHAVEAVIPGFSAESSAVVQGKSCVDRAISHGFDVAMSGGSCGKDTSPAHLARSQPGVGTQYAHVGYPGVELVSRTYISRKKRDLETVQRHSKALKKAQRDAKRKFIAQLEISHEAAELILRNQAARTDEKFPGTIHVSHHLALLHGHENVFFCTQCGAVNAGGALRLLKSQCDGSANPVSKRNASLSVV